MRILMVCLGNICRSPLAEGIMLQKLTEHNLTWEVNSAGTGGWHVGEAPDPRSIRVAQKNQLDISRQQSRQFKQQDFEDFDLIFAMDQSNFRNILNLAKTPEQGQKVKLILEMANGTKQDVPDPYYGDDGFEAVYQMLDEACGIILAELLNQKNML